MNRNLSQFIGQLRGIWGQLGLNQRVTVVLATGLVVAGVLALSLWSSRSEYALLYGKLSDAEASRVASALDDAKIPYKTGSSAGSILVPAEKVHAVRMQLASRGIPRADGVGFEIFDKPNFGISDFVQRANYVRAVQGELSRTIGQLDEIEQARVMIVMPENRLLADKDRHPTASVFVKVRGNGTMQPQAVNAIRFLVANSVEGLKPGFVSIVDSQGNALSENTEDDSPTGLSSSQFAVRKNLEQYLSRKVEGMLDRVLGPGQAIVRVSAEVNYDTITTVAETFDPDSQVVRSETKNDENVDTSQANPNATVGMAANSASTNGAAATPLSSSKNQKVTARVEYEISKTTSNILHASGGIRRLSAAVSVAARQEGEGANRKTTPRSAEEMEKLRRMVASAIGADPKKGDDIIVEELPFNDDLRIETAKHLQEDGRWQFWLGVARTAGYPATALLVLFLLIRLLKKTPVEEIPLGVPVGSMNGGRSGNGNGDWLRHPQKEAVSLDVLNQLVKEHPGNMTQAVRSWLSRGGPKDAANP